MPGLVMLSPIVFDHEFPRNSRELDLVSDALGNIQESVDSDGCHVLLTPLIEEALAGFSWERCRSEMAILRDIFRLLQEWVLNPSPRYVMRSFEGLDSPKHPLPVGCVAGAAADLWQSDAGLVLRAHEKTRRDNEVFIGVACPSGFTGGPLGSYVSGSAEERFPLVGPKEVALLADAYHWECDLDTARKSVSFGVAYKNFGALGAIEIRKPNGGSHYSVVFKGGRTWSLDKNDDPIPDAYFSGLVDITGLPTHAIKQALITGEAPRRRLKLDGSDLCHHVNSGS